MTAYRRISFSLLLALVCALVAGCGGGDEEPPPTKAAFIKEAEAICLEADKKQESGFQAATKDTPTSKLTENVLKELFVEVGFPPLEEEVEELKELTPPEGDEEQIEALFDEVEEALEKGKADVDSMASEATSPFRTVDQKGRKYGFVECSDFS